MGSSNSSHFQFYNSNTTKFYHYDLDVSHINYSVLDFAVKFTCDENKTIETTFDEILRTLQKNKVNGVKLCNFLVSINNVESLEIWSQLTYLEVKIIPGLPSPALFKEARNDPNVLINYLKKGPNINDLHLSTGTSIRIPREFWKLLSTRKMECVQIERCDVSELSTELLKIIMENTMRIIFEECVLCKIIKDSDLTNLYLDKRDFPICLDTAITTEYHKNEYLENNLIIPNFVRLLHPDKSLLLSRGAPNEQILRAICESGKKIDSLQLRDPVFYDVRLNFVNTIHIWDYDLDILYKYIENNPNINKITSCMDAVTLDRYNHFMSKIKKLDRDIEVLIHYKMPKTFE